MLCKCRFNPKSDIKQVVPGQTIDVVESIKTGTVLPTASEPFYNSIEDIKKVGKRIHDYFDVMEAQGMLANSISSNSEESNT